MSAPRGAKREPTPDDDLSVLGRLTFPTAPPPPPSPPPFSSREGRSCLTPAATSSQPEPTGSKKRKLSDSNRSDDEKDDLFGCADARLEVIDLADTEDVPASLTQQTKKLKNEIRLSAFQCVICMDDVTNLTVTHCGHLFCSECLHSSLHIDMSKRICPICRQKIDPKPPSGKFTQRARGYYPLELKLTTKKSLGKRTASL